MSSYNLPLLSIPAFYVLSVVPHAVAISVASKGDRKRHDNRNPRGSDFIAKLKSTLSPRDFAKWERAESCHRNGFEHLPIYIATVLASIYASRESGHDLGTTTFAALFLAVRALYTANYITVETRTWSYARSLLYFVGIILCFNQIVKAARALGDVS